MKYRLGVISLALTMGAACSDGTLDSERAARLIGELDQFKREARFTIQNGCSASVCVQVPDAAADRERSSQPIRRRSWMGALRNARGESRLRREGIVSSIWIDRVRTGGLGGMDPRSRRYHRKRRSFMGHSNWGA